jgi:hypothetical protein
MSPFTCVTLNAIELTRINFSQHRTFAITSYVPFLSEAQAVSASIRKITPSERPTGM